MKKLLPFLLVALVAAGELTFDAALRRAEEHSPVLKRARAEQATVDKTKELYLAGTAPELEISTENLGIGEVELVVSKELRHSAKRKPLLAEQNLRREKAVLENRPALLELHRQVAENYIELTFLAESQKRILSIITSLKEEKGDITRRVKLGAASELELLEHEGLIISMDEMIFALESDMRSTQRALNTLWEEDVVCTPLSLDELKQFFSTKESDLISPEHPLLQRMKVAKSEAALLRLQSDGSSKPDFSLSSGYKRSNETGENSFLLGLTIGFNQKRDVTIGNAEAALIEKGLTIEKTAVTREIAKGVLLFKEKRLKLESLQTSLLEKRMPLAESLIEAAQKRYARGVLPIYEMIRYRRELYHLQLEELEIKKELLQNQMSQILYTGTLLN